MEFSPHYKFVNAYRKDPIWSWKMIYLRNIFLPWAGALVWWLWEETHIPKVVGSNPDTVYWMDIFSHLFVVKIVMCF